MEVPDLSPSLLALPKFTMLQVHLLNLIFVCSKGLCIDKHNHVPVSTN